MHAGHINLLRRCAELGRVTVSLLSDKSYERYRGYPPAVSFANRRAVLESIRYVDDVIEGDNEQTLIDLLRLKPDYAVVGSDWASRDIYKQWGVSQDWFDSHNIMLLYLPYTQGVSSSAIKEGMR